MSIRPATKAEPPAHHNEPRHSSLAAVLETAGDAIVVTDAEGRVVFWNAAATRDWQWVPNEALGQPVETLLFADQGHFAEIRAEVKRAGQWRGHIATIAKQGQLVVQSATFSACEPGDGERGGWLMSCRIASSVAGDPKATLRLERLEAYAREMARSGHRLNNVLSPFTMGVDLLRQRLTAASDAALIQTLEGAVEKAVQAVDEIVVRASRAMSGANPHENTEESRAREMELFR